MKNFLTRFKSPKKILIITLLFAALFRFYGLDWDQGHHLHPDERMLIMVAGRIELPQNLKDIFTPESSLNPKFFPYGSFPIYFLKFFSNVTAFVFHNPLLANYDLMNLVGRFLSGLFDIGTIFLIIKLGGKVFSPRTGLLAGIFYALCAFPIQLSHFFAVDTFLTFFVIATIYRLIIFYEKPSLKNAIFIGIFFGLSLATKISATILLSSIGTAIIIDLILVSAKRVRLFLKHRKIFYSSETKITIVKSKLKKLTRFVFISVKFLSVIFILSAVTFFVCEPYAVIDFPTFLRQTREQQVMTKNAYVFPYTLQYVGTTPYLYHLKNFILWGSGIPLGIISVTAIVYLIYCLVREFPKPGNEEQEAKMLILFSFFSIYFLVVGNFAVKFMRYLLPLYPIFFLFAAWFLEKISRKFKVSLVLAASIVLLPTVSWSIALSSIYSRPTTRVAASEWISSNISPGSFIATEHWDDGLPLFGGEKYQFLEMPMYENDQASWKWEKVNSNLQKANYIILASNRLYVPLQKLSDCQKYKVCYPKTAKYYQDLFSGKLGFQKVAEFSSYPSLPLISQYLNISISIPDDSADESFTVYDHPKIIIFKKSEKIQ